MKKLCLTFVLALLGASCFTLAVSSSESAGVSSAPPENSANPTSYAMYLANAGVLVAHGETKIAFDPIFRVSFGSYLLLSEELERSLFAGEPPFDGLDAVFISHNHGDHFSAADVLRLMTTHPTLELFAPQQAVEGVRAINRTLDAPAASDLFDRVHSIALDYEDEPVTLQEEGLLVEAVRIPHSGWPDRMQNVENIAFRVSLLGPNDPTTGEGDGGLTAAHLGDADIRDDHFDHDAGYWAKRPLDVAFPPYWYLQSEDGRSILTTRLDPKLTVGVHVPVQFGSDEKATISNLGDDISVFTEPRERRVFEP